MADNMPAEFPKNDASADIREQFPHYHKFVGHLKYVDVYRVLQLFEQHNPCIQHAIKKLLVPGKRSGGKTSEQDIREAIVSLNRALQMIAEDDQPRLPAPAPGVPQAPETRKPWG